MHTRPFKTSKVFNLFIFILALLDFFFFLAAHRFLSCGEWGYFLQFRVLQGFIAVVCLLRAVVDSWASVAVLSGSRVQAQ